jgi:hypothetical protein
VLSDRDCHLPQRVTFLSHCHAAGSREGLNDG